jgi:RHS repeat-associated protein
MTNGLRELVLSWRSALGCAVIGAVIALASLPVQAAVGRTAGSFDVSSTGSALYSIQIFSSPGPRGLQPSVALAYNSNGGTGYVGKGWTLQGTGFSSIRRCGRNLAQDGAATPVQLQYSDGYCLDGNRLRLQSGSYGQSGSVWATEIADFSRITAYGQSGGGPAYWVVERKDGTTWTYGNTTDSQVLATGTTTASQWMVNEIRDRQLNKMLFTWKSPNGTTSGTTHPVKIQWTQTSYNSGSYVYSMDFTYGAGAQPGGYFGYIAGTQVLETDLLTAITVSTSGSVSRHYVLTHDTSPTSGARRLTQVKECADSAASNCLEPTAITYQDGQTGVNISTPALSVSGNVTAAQGRYDFNSDGIKDIAYNLAGTWRVRMGSPSSGYGSEINTGLSGDLRAGKLFDATRDALLFLSGSTWYAYIWNGSSFAGSSTGITTSASATDLVLMDADGDGRDDLVYVTGASFAPFWGNPNVMLPVLELAVRRNTATYGSLSFAAPVTSQAQLYPFFVNMPGYPPPGTPAVAQLTAWTPSAGGDLDGDRHQELKVQTSYTWCYYYPTPYCTGAGELPLFARFDQNLNYVPASMDAAGLLTDINHDGCQDLKVPSGVALSNCTAYGVGATLGGGSSVADWTGDGQGDALSWGGGSTLVAYPFLGNSFGAGQNTGIPATSACKLVVTDGNGDGLDDFGCLIPGSSLTLYYHNGTNTPQDLVAHFVDGFGITHSPTYGSITGSVYTAYTNAVYPNRDVLGDRVVVGSVAASDGIGGTFNTTYSYFGGVENLYGRGFQGFDKIEATDSRNSVKRLRIFRRDFPYSGAVADEWVFQPGGAAISARTITMASTTLDSTAYNQRYFIYQSSSTENAYEVGGASNGAWITQATVSNTFDSWGNLTASTRTITDKDAYSALYGQSWTTATSVSITPNTTYWCLGLPSSSSVTSSTTTGEATVVQSRSFTPDSINCRMSAESVGSSNLQVDTSYGYDSFGNVNSVSVTGRNPNGSSMSARTTTTSWGATGQFPASETNALGEPTTRTFHSTFGSPLTQTDPNGIVVATNEYDSFGRPTRSIRADGTATRVTYAACATYGCQNGDPASGATGINMTIAIASERNTSDAPVRDSWTYLDQLDRPIVQKAMTVTGAYSRSGTQYDALGQLYRQTAPCDASSCTAYWVTHTHDLAGRVATQSRPQSQSVSTPVTTTYAYAGRTQTVTDPNGKVTTRILDVNGGMRRSQDHNGYYQSFAYDAAGNLTQVSDSLSNTLFTAAYSYGIQAFQTSSTDMDLGATYYWRNSLGELVQTQDAKGQTFNMTYDALSRLTSRTEAEGTTTWTWGTSAGSHNIGSVASVSMTGYGESVAYDSAGRPSSRTITTDQSYAIDYSYTNQGLVDTLTYPTSTSSTRVKVKYGYDYGILKSVTDWTSGSAGTVYWTANAQNLRGQTTQETLGNGVVTNRNFDAVTGWLNSIQSDGAASIVLQNHSYLYDKVGNVTQRQDTTPGRGLTESFYYDNLYRLDYSQLNGSTNLDLAYDAMGNITNRTDVNGNASWTYLSTKKHAVATTGTGGVSYSYDANGNMVSRNGQTISWSSYNYPTTLATANESTGFYYGPDRQYYKQVYTGPSGTETTHYVGGLLEKVSVGSNTDWRHSIVAEGQVVAIVSRSTSGNAVYYPLEDNQGSGSVLTNSSGTNLVRQSYNAFGLPRDGADWDGAEQSGDQAIIDGISRRGYTGHSMLGAMGLIHMNGRVQDAITGRFLSPDPTIPDAGFTQSYNRYAYVNNNPMSFIDPSGFTPSGGCNPETATQCDENGFYLMLRHYLGSACRISCPELGEMWSAVLQMFNPYSSEWVNGAFENTAFTMEFEYLMAQPESGQSYGASATHTNSAGVKWTDTEPAELGELRASSQRWRNLERALWSNSIGESGLAPHERGMFVFRSLNGEDLQFVRWASTPQNPYGFSGDLKTPSGYQLVAAFHTHPWPHCFSACIVQGPSRAMQPGEMKDAETATAFPNAYHYIWAKGYVTNPNRMETYYYGPKVFGR